MIAIGVGEDAHVHDGYRHEALLWSGIDEFVAGTAPFVLGGVEAAEPVLVAVPEEHWSPMREALGPAADEVLYVDMAELGANPARIIPRWLQLVETAEGMPVRGVGEPIWAGRQPVEIDESQLHEALLSIAVGPDAPLWLRCPYDVDGLDDDVLAAAERSHPMLVQDGEYRGSVHYEGSEYAASAVRQDLPLPTAPVRRLDFDAGGVGAARAAVRQWARAAGIADSRAEDLALAAHEAVVNSVLHGGGTGHVQSWREADAFVCEVRDGGALHDLLAGRKVPVDDDAHGRGLWMVNHLCDLVQIRSAPAGTVVRMVVWQ